jgi:hypothetical protein
MGFEGLGDLMRSRCLSQETPKPRRFSQEGTQTVDAIYPRPTLYGAWRVNLIPDALPIESIAALD